MGVLSINSLHIKVQIQVTDMAQIHSTNSLVDCGANGLFLNIDYI
jgi:hypothetical protein